MVRTRNRPKIAITDTAIADRSEVATARSITVPMATGTSASQTWCRDQNRAPRAVARRWRRKIPPTSRRVARGSCTKATLSGAPAPRFAIRRGAGRPLRQARCRCPSVRRRGAVVDDRRLSAPRRGLVGRSRRGRPADAVRLGAAPARSRRLGRRDRGPDGGGQPVRAGAGVERRSLPLVGTTVPVQLRRVRRLQRDR